MAELLSQVADIEKVLVICPTSLKSQWRDEIRRFCDRDCQLVLGSAEERMLETLSDKRDLAMAALDPDADVDTLQLRSNMEDLKSRLETLLGRPPAAAEHRAEKKKVDQKADDVMQQRQRVAQAGADVMTARCHCVSELVPAEKSASPDPKVVLQVRSGLNGLVGKDEQGRPQLQVALPDTGTLDQLSNALATLIGMPQKQN